MYAIWKKDDSYTIAMEDGYDLSGDWTLYKGGFISWIAAHDFICRMK